jgi:hypothetical protein
MKVIQYGTRFTFEVEGTTAIECFDQLAKLNSTFNVPACDVTNSGEPSDNVEPNVREVADPKNPKNQYTYREFRCKEAPYARLSMGSHRTGESLFPKKEWETGPVREETTV